MKTRKESYERAYKICQKYVGHDTRINHANGDQEVIDVVNTINNRSTRVPYVSVKEFCDDLIRQKLRLFAQNLPDQGYSMGSYVRVYFNKLRYLDDRTKEYAKSCKWRARHGEVNYTLTKREYQTFNVIGGVITFIEPNQKSRVKKCTWLNGVNHKGDFKIIKVEGYIYEGYHSTSKNGALMGGKLNIQRAKEQEQRERENLKKRIENEKKYNKALRLQYSYQDSIDCGNCEVGTKAFIMRLKLNPNNKYRGSFLIKRASEESPRSLPFITKMINYKIHK